MSKKKIIIYLLITLLISISSLIPVYAAGASVNSSSSTGKVVVGNTVSFTFKINSSQASYSMAYSISYDSSKLSYVGGSGISNGAMVLSGEKNKTITVKFKAKSSGNPTVKISGQICASNCLSFSGSKSVKIISQAEYEASKSSNNYLSSLSVEGAKLNPSFNKNTTSYTVDLPANTESIKINGSKADKRSSVSGLGKHSVEDGKNTIKISVVAENGSERVYKITANVKELDPIKVKVEDKEYTIVRKAKLLKTPNNTFSDTEIEYKDVKIPGFVNEKANLTLIGLKDKDGDINLFIYKDDEFIPYNEYSFSTLNLFIENKEIDSYKTKEEIEINDHIINAYKLDDTDYYYLYGINLDNGEENIYRYDSQDKTIQRYIENTKDPKAKKNNNTKTTDDDVNLYKIIIISLLGFIFLTYIVILFIILIKGKKKNIKINNNIEEGEKEVESIVENEEIIEEPILEELEEETKEEEIIEEQTENNPEPSNDDMYNILEGTQVINKTPKKKNNKKKSSKKKGD